MNFMLSYSVSLNKIDLLDFTLSDYQAVIFLSPISPTSQGAVQLKRFVKTKVFLLHAECVFRVGQGQNNKKTTNWELRD